MLLTKARWRIKFIASAFIATMTISQNELANKKSYCQSKNPSEHFKSSIARNGLILRPESSVSLKFIDEIKCKLKPEQIETDTEECILKSKPWNSYHKSGTYPMAILYPNSTEDVSHILRICNKYGISVVPYGGGTSLEGQLLPSTPVSSPGTDPSAPPKPTNAISLDMNNMKKILQLNEQDLDVRVQTGLGYVELNEFLKPKNLWFPLDPGPGASIGGMCSCRYVPNEIHPLTCREAMDLNIEQPFTQALLINIVLSGAFSCSGSTAVRYGSMRENVLSLTAVLPDGTVFTTGSRARKSSAGYDLTRLLIGSEATLAVITEATLKLHGIPKVRDFSLNLGLNQVIPHGHFVPSTLPLPFLCD